jgi:hypothetical protein
MCANKVANYLDAENFILTLIYTWYIGSRLYTSDLHVLTIDI